MTPCLFHFHMTALGITAVLIRVRPVSRELRLRGQNIPRYRWRSVDISSGQWAAGRV